MAEKEYAEILHLEEEVWRKELEVEWSETCLESRMTLVEVGAGVECRLTGAVEDHLLDQHRPPSPQPRCQA